MLVLTMLGSSKIGKLWWWWGGGLNRIIHKHNSIETRLLPET